MWIGCTTTHYHTHYHALPPTNTHYHTHYHAPQHATTHYHKHYHALPHTTAHYHTLPHTLPCTTTHFQAHYHALPHTTTHYHTHITMHYHTLPHTTTHTTMHYHTTTHTTMHYHTLSCTTTHYHTLPCTTMHLHTLHGTTTNNHVANIDLLIIIACQSINILPPIRNALQSATLRQWHSYSRPPTSAADVTFSDTTSSLLVSGKVMFRVLLIRYHLYTLSKQPKSQGRTSLSPMVAAGQVSPNSHAETLATETEQRRQGTLITLFITDQHVPNATVTNTISVVMP